MRLQPLSLMEFADRGIIINRALSAVIFTGLLDHGLTYLAITYPHVRFLGAISAGARAWR